MSTAWALELTDLRPAENVEGLVDVSPLLRVLVASYNQNVVAHMLDVDRSAINRWLKDRRSINETVSARIAALHTVLSAVHRYYNPVIAARWLLGAEPLLGGARPLDALTINGATPVLQALEARVAGGFA